MADTVQIAAMAPPSQPRNVSRSKGLIERSDNLQHRPSPAHSKIPADEGTSTSQLQHNFQSSMKHLEINEKGMPRSDAPSSARAGLRLEDDQTHISGSSTKQTSSDSRSAISGATFALDEKESLRPDDSASTRATEDEDSFSGVASAAPSSRVGSEAGGRAFRDQFNEISERIDPTLHRLQTINRRGVPGVIEHRSQPTQAPHPPAVSLPMNGSEDSATNGIIYMMEKREPDEKLLEALQSPKDRLFLLQLEQQVISFIKNSSDPVLDLPPCNSFCRLLAHKLADYYFLTHFVDNAQSAVRLYRTPYCRVPTPLSNLAKQSGPKENTLISQPNMKIMRREGIGKDGANSGSGANTTTSSMAASKANSETGNDSQGGTGLVSPSDSVTAKERATMTREEREAKYKETRDRIFKGFEDTESTEANNPSEPANGISRTNSGTGKKKSKKSRHRDDDFEARSQFNAYYPMQYPTSSYEQTTGAVTFFNPYSMPQDGMANQSGAMNAQMFPNVYPQGYPTISSGPMYQMGMQTPVMSRSEMPDQGGGLYTYSDYGQQYSEHYYPQMSRQPMMGQQSPVISSPAMGNNSQASHSSSQTSDQSWPPNDFSYWYQQPQPSQQSYSPLLHQRTPVRSVPTVSYQYGQLPFQPNRPPGKAQHPLPGSYNRQAFNPQTRAFVPGAGFSAGHGSPMSTPNGGSTRAAHAKPSSGSSNNLPSKQTSNSHNSSKNSASTPTQTYRTTSSQGSPQPSSLAKWGVPANLPPKPPPPDTPAMPGSLPTNPVNVHGSMHVQPMMHGQPMPSYQNGIYSMPGGKSQEKLP